jgi:hypothetical protein
MLDPIELQVSIFEMEFTQAITHQPLPEARKAVADYLQLLEYKKDSIIRLRPQVTSLVSGLETLSIAFSIQSTESREELKAIAVRICRMLLKLNILLKEAVSGIC